MRYFYYYFEDNEIDYLTAIPIPKRQKLMKDSGIIDIIIEIIHINMSKDFDQNNYFKKQFFDIFYHLLRISVMEYRPNELYASQWLDFIRKIALEKKGEVGLNLALTELIDNNEKILTT